jgi:hypothetical protein
VATPRVLQATRHHFGCSDLPVPGMEQEDGGGSGSAGSHWEKRLLYDSLSGPTRGV